jgi:hypothetical protein
MHIKMSVGRYGLHIKSQALMGLSALTESEGPTKITCHPSSIRSISLFLSHRLIGLPKGCLQRNFRIKIIYTFYYEDWGQAIA